MREKKLSAYGRQQSDGLSSFIQYKKKTGENKKVPVIKKSINFFIHHASISENQLDYFRHQIFRLIKTGSLC
jgi:uncharacterized alpha/beta hydrolase family protein